ncbi:hypothetical protein TNCV_4585381 [Trichonephila clavipes]|nr:hypothetical protein TNCV_4585381 [Trichonephila clavipes]
MTKADLSRKIRVKTFWNPVFQRLDFRQSTLIALKEPSCDWHKILEPLSTYKISEMQSKESCSRAIGVSIGAVIKGGKQMSWPPNLKPPLGLGRHDILYTADLQWHQRSKPRVHDHNHPLGYYGHEETTIPSEDLLEVYRSLISFFFPPSSVENQL